MKFWLAWAAGLAAMLLVSIWGFSQWNLSHYTDYIGSRLELLAELRRGALEEYLETAEAELHFWSKNDSLIDLQQELNAIWQTSGDEVAEDIYQNYIADNPHPPGFLLNLDNAEDGSAYSQLHVRIHPMARLFVTQRGYYDFFLIGPQGDVLYTVEKESDFSTNLEHGSWKESGLAKVFRSAKSGESGSRVAISDMQAYGPSAGAPAIFMASALHNEAGAFIGVLALQLPTDRILGIMAYTSGMGDTGETYLVGGDYLMRSDSRFSEEGTVLSQQVDTPAVRRALAGESGREMIEDYRGVEVMSGFVPLELGKTRWAVMAEMDQAEVATFAASQRPPISGALMLFYGLSLWSVWYWRGRAMPGEGPQLGSLELHAGDDAGMGGVG